ncbi:hypothetical protein K469DRAFT_707074 [Zopfia rhizophila CBS 207.26]|uniref:Uncharacterized protein n=1 Tax=Zopfia rhizophila CBS 207.26 TaxID=1314779 RepID=A0A6A6E6M3_9PEZI|nr:hypothetical protein K469DRAFT_707074 [Zopfia rhizophila CBS 207.26]
MHLNLAIVVVGVLVRESMTLPTKYSGQEATTNWYADSAAGVAESIGRREEATNWYTDSASGVAESLHSEKRDEKTNWYTDSAAGVAGSLSPEKRDEKTNWYADSAAGVAESLESRKASESTNWYADSAKGVVEALDQRDANKATNWYADSASGVADSLSEREAAKDTNWYADSADGVAGSLDNIKRDEKTNWYSDSASGVTGSLESRRDEKTNWYADSAKGMLDSLAKRVGMTHSEKESYEKALREWIYYDMRGKPLRESSERGKAFFEFTPKPRHDKVDRWHVPAELQERFNATDSDAERVSILNYYLMVTGREPKSAKELGFTPTADKPGLVETNEVGYGYALAGQHQYHCVDFVADAIDIGKERLNDFFLKHTIHCLGLMKYLAPQLTMKQPLSYLLTPANQRLLNDYPQTIEGSKACSTTSI